MQRQRQVLQSQPQPPQRWCQGPQPPPFRQRVPPTRGQSVRTQVQGGTMLTLDAGFLEPALDAGLTDALEAGFTEPALEAGFDAAFDAGLAAALDAGLAAALDAGLAAAFDAGLAAAFDAGFDAGLAAAALDAGLALIIAASDGLLEFSTRCTHLLSSRLFLRSVLCGTLLAALGSIVSSFLGGLFRFGLCGSLLRRIRFGLIFDTGRATGLGGVGGVGSGFARHFLESGRGWGGEGTQKG